MNTTSTTIPQLDYRLLTADSSSARNHFCNTLGEAFENFGFLALNHLDIPHDLLDQTYDHCRNFFAQPAAWKHQFTPKNMRGQVGYVCFGQERAKHASTYDLKEFWHVNRLSATSQSPAFIDPLTTSTTETWLAQPYWPPGHPGFRHSLSALYKFFDKLSQQLLRVASQYLQLPPSSGLDDMCRYGPTLLRAAYYPACDPNAHPASLRAAAHEDINFITLLCASTTQGLEIKLPHNHWIPIEIYQNSPTIIVSTGDMLQNITNGRFRSTTHRVINHNQCRNERLSLPYFVHPHPNTELTPLKSCILDTTGSAQYPAITAAQYLNQRLKDINLDSAQT